ncbi:hypothetical protein D3C81_1372170 [compost metagenome]
MLKKPQGDLGIVRTLGMMAHLVATADDVNAAIDRVDQLTWTYRVQGDEDQLELKHVVGTEHHGPHRELSGALPQVLDIISIHIRHTVLHQGALCLQILSHDVEIDATIGAIQQVICPAHCPRLTCRSALRST